MEKREKGGWGREEARKGRVEILAVPKNKRKKNPVSDGSSLAPGSLCLFQLFCAP